MFNSSKYLIPIFLICVSLTGFAQDSTSSLYSTLYNQGAEAISKQDYRKAVSLFNQAIQLNTNYAEAIHARGTSYLMLNERENACADFRLAAEQNWKPSKDYIRNYCSSNAIGRKVKPQNQTPVKRIDEH